MFGQVYMFPVCIWGSDLGTENEEMLSSDMWDWASHGVTDGMSDSVLT